MRWQQQILNCETEDGNKIWFDVVSSIFLPISTISMDTRVEVRRDGQVRRENQGESYETNTEFTRSAPSSFRAPFISLHLPHPNTLPLTSLQLPPAPLHPPTFLSSKLTFSTNLLRLPTCSLSAILPAISSLPHSSHRNLILLLLLPYPTFYL